MKGIGARQSRGAVGRSVLLVEDEVRLREMLLRAVREMGFQPAGAASAEQGLRAMEQEPKPVVIVDLNLPGASGMEFLGTVRRRWPNTQAIILTGFGDLQAAKQAIHLDVVDFLTKPCALGDLEIALSRAFQRLDRIELPTPAFASEDVEENADGIGELDDDEDYPGEPGPRGKHRRPEPAPLAFTPREGSEAMSLEDVERRAILEALEKHNGNRAAAAAALGISLRKLYYRLAQYQENGAGPV